MEYLLIPKNLKVLESFSMVKTLYAFDYDGTLAALQSEPSKAYMTDTVHDLLYKLSKVANVAIITGREVSDIKKFLNFEPQFIIGNHGIEGIHSEGDLKMMEDLTNKWKLKLKNLPPEVMLEDKKYSLSLHYRSDISPLMPTLRSLPGASLIEGKSVVNIVPGMGTNKGQAMDYLMNKHGFHFGFYIGDDKTDENVFAYKTSRLFTVKVGEDPNSLAKYFISSQAEIVSLLLSLNNFQKRIL